MQLLSQAVTKGVSFVYEYSGKAMVADWNESIRTNRKRLCVCRIIFPISSNCLRLATHRHSLTHSP